MTQTEPYTVESLSALSNEELQRMAKEIEGAPINDWNFQTLWITFPKSTSVRFSSHSGDARLGIYSGKRLIKSLKFPLHVTEINAKRIAYLLSKQG